MKIRQWLILILVVPAGCHSVGNNSQPKQHIAIDTSKQPLANEASPKNEIRSLPKTHLKDTFRVSGKEFVFLCPDQARYDTLAADEDNEMGTVSEDFEVGIRNTLDSVKANTRYKKIRVWVTVQRYILIKDCKDGPLLIDRDTVTYGYIMTAPGKPIASEYNSVHSGNYLREMDDYFFP
jgi:hypothetical protein